MEKTLRKLQILRKTPPSVQNPSACEPLVVTAVGTHGKIQLNRPEALNAVTNYMINEIRRGSLVIVRFSKDFLDFLSIKLSKP